MELIQLQAQKPFYFPHLEYLLHPLCTFADTSAAGVRSLPCGENLSGYSGHSYYCNLIGQDRLDL